MSNYDVNVNFKVDSSGLGKAQQEVDKVTSSLKNAASSAAPVGNSIKGGLAQAVTAASGVSAGFAGMATAATAAIAPMAALAVAAAPLTLVAVALAGIAVAVGGVFSVVSGRLGDINSMADAMDNLGGRTQALAELFAVMEVSGQGFEKTAASLQKFQNNIAKVVESGDEVAAAMGRAGIDMRKLAEIAKTDVAGAYKEVISKLADVNDKNDLALIKQKLLGKSLAETAQIANDAADYENKLALARSIGLVQTEKQKQLAQELDNSWDELKAAGKGLATQMVDMFGPTVVTLVKGLSSGIVVVAQSMQSVNLWVQKTFGSFDTLLRKFNPIYALAVKLFGLTGRMAKQNAAAYATPGSDAPAEPAAPVTNTTDADAAKAAARAEAAASKAAAARAKAAAEAQRNLDAYNKLLERQVELMRQITADSVTEGFGTMIKEQTPELIEQFEAAVATAKQVGLTVEGWTTSADNTVITLQTGINPAMEETARLAGKTAEELKKAGDAAIAASVERAIANKNDALHLDILKTTTDYTTKAANDYNLVAEIAAGRIVNEQQLAKYLSDQAFYAQILKMEKAGANEEDIQALKNARELAEIEGRGLERTKQDVFGKAEEAKEFYNTVTTGFVDTFIDGLKTGKMAWKEWLADLATQLLKSYLLKLLAQYLPMLGGAAGTVGAGTVGTVNTGASYANYAAKGAWFDGGMSYFANGGVVNRATAFGMMNGKTGVMGEAGPEAIMPLTRGPNGKLGISAHGGGGTQVINLGNTTINVQSTSDTSRDDRDTARAIDKMLEEKLTRWMAEQRRSGNALNPNFGYRY
jgi:hypothetical protein